MGTSPPREIQTIEGELAQQAFASTMSDYVLTPVARADHRGQSRSDAGGCSNSPAMCRAVSPLRHALFKPFHQFNITSYRPGPRSCNRTGILAHREKHRRCTYKLLR